MFSEINTIHLIRNTDKDRGNKITKFIKWNTSTLKHRKIGPFSTDIITVFLYPKCKVWHGPYIE